MKHIKAYIAAAMIGFTGVMSVSAQNALRTGYFLEGYTYRHMLNPAFAPERSYVAFPALGNINLNLTSNVGLSTFLYPTKNGELTTFMSPDVKASKFLGKLKSVNHIDQNLDLMILSFGFRGFGGYNTFTLSSRTAASFALPKDLFTFMKLGQTKEHTHYNFKNLGIEASEIVELGFGHSRQINEKLRAGVKVKALLGVGNVSARISNMDVTLSNDLWEVKANGEVNIAGGSGLKVPTKGESGKHLDNSGEATLIDWDNIDYDKFGLAGFGMGLDLGATYQLLPDLELSAAITDLSFMSWSNVHKGKTSETSWKFEGFHDIALDKNDPNYEDKKLDQQLEDLGDQFEESVEFHKVGGKSSRMSGVGATITVGGMYTVPYVRFLKGGLLLTQRINGHYSWTEGRISANLTPVGWFDASVNYAVSTFGSSFGWIVNFHPKGINLFLGSDFQIFKVTPQYVPVGNLNASVNFGFNITFGGKKKKA